MDLLHAVKSYDVGPPALLPIREEGMLRIFIALKNSIPSAGFELATLGSSGKNITETTQELVVTVFGIDPQVYPLIQNCLMKTVPRPSS
jgi:hypothetical protein